MPEKVTWVLTSGEAGLRSQALGLGATIGLPVLEKRVAVRPPWSWVPGGLLPMPLSGLASESDPLTAPWPCVVVGCGRRSIGPALAVKRLSGGASLAVYIQNPDFALPRFDLVAAMPHDGLAGPNVTTARTALHGVTPERLEEAAARWRGELAPAGAPALGVLLGGDNPAYRLTDRVVDDLVSLLRQAHAVGGFRATITPSRRTGEAIKRRLRDALAKDPWATIWSGSGDNPYLGILALSDRLIVTSESISMISEALAAGRPVHVLPLEGRGERHDAFLRDIIGAGLVSLIRGGELDWGFAGGGPVNATPEVGRRIRDMLRQEGR